MKNFVAMLLLLAAFGKPVFAQNQNYFKDGMYQFDDTRKILKSEIFTTYKSYFGLAQNNSMVLQRESAMDKDGGVSGSYQQYCNGYPVEMCQMNVISKYGVVLFANGFTLPNLNTNVSSPISEATALGYALSYVNAPQYAWQDAALEASVKYKYDLQTGDSLYDSTATYYPKGTLAIAMPYGDTSYTDTSKYTLCWKFTITPMKWDTAIVDTSEVDTVVALDTVIGYKVRANTIVYVNAKTGTIFTENPNVYGGGYRTCHVDSTWYHGKQDVQAWKSTLGTLRVARDERGLTVSDYYHQSNQWGIHNDTWTKSTAATAYWELERIWDYWHDVHEFNGTNTSGWNEQHIIFGYLLSAGLGDERMAYQPCAVGEREDYHIQMDHGDEPSESAAQLDILGHEYTHALIHRKPSSGGFLNFDQPGAIAEGFCDYFGTKAAIWAYPSRYSDDWPNGFGRNSGLLKRYFSSPPSDKNGPSMDTYHYPIDGNIYKSSGILRKVFWLSEEGGIHNTLIVPARPATPAGEPDATRDALITMMWWCWGNMSYFDLRNAFMNEYKYYHGECSPAWISMDLAWTSVGFVNVVPCVGVCRVSSPGIIPIFHGKGLGQGPNGSAIKQPTDPGNGPHNQIVIRHITGNENVQVQSYSWSVPQGVYTSHPQNDMSVLQIDSLYDTASHYYTCIVTYTDTAYHPDTLTAVIHFVGEDYETINNKGANHSIISSNNTEAMDGLTVYPNPVKTQLNVTLPYAPSSPMEYHVFDLTGREVSTGRQYLYWQENVIQLPNMPAGIYILKIKGSGKEYIRRISVQQ